VSDAAAIRPSMTRAWIGAARPPTLVAAAVPVFVGCAVAHAQGRLEWAPAIAALLGAFLIQIGTNFANDVFDFEKGADTAERLGPTRAVQAGLVSPGRMRRAMWLMFGLSVLVGVYLTTVVGPLVLLLGAVSIASGIGYTGGPFPLAYNGLGDLFVFVFFGFAAVLGTVWVANGAVSWLAFAAAIPIGALSTAILVVNNLRDVDTDRKAGKKTLAVRFGTRAAFAEYVALLAIAFATPIAMVALGLASPWVLASLVAAPLALFLLVRIPKTRGRALNPMLVRTAQLLLLFGIPFTAGLALG
jgi:1,4-dihydroxy-2-naphthoate polyprenyltransferase